MTEIAADMLPRVLIVDDDVSTARVLIRCLERRCALNCTTATDGFEAFRILGNRHFSLLITDMAMPNMSGMELLRLAKERYPAMRRILFTGYSDASLVLADRDNADAILEKGGDIGPLCSTICRLATTPRDADG
jgi:DNA-binding NtrC family response regulator